MDCMDERRLATPPKWGGGGSSRPRRQLLTISSPRNELNTSTWARLCNGFGSGGSLGAFWLDDRYVVLCDDDCLALSMSGVADAKALVDEELLAISD